MNKKKRSVRPRFLGAAHLPAGRVPSKDLLTRDLLRIIGSKIDRSSLDWTRCARLEERGVVCGDEGSCQSYSLVRRREDVGGRLSLSGYKI